MGTFYDKILGKRISLTYGGNGFASNYIGEVKSIIGDVVIIDNLSIIFCDPDIDITYDGENFFVKMNNETSAIISILDNIRQ